ncbi:hypothetical protein ACL9RF_03520 [Sphingobacterium sp. Mn56C]|uniref:hypothetical protein n=1 Tax=Sphingobacterium sp. Mn56C TaxID=3395261 RepID=UPI003BE00A12
MQKFNRQALLTFTQTITCNSLLLVLLVLLAAGCRSQQPQSTGNGISLNEKSAVQYLHAQLETAHPTNPPLVFYKQEVKPGNLSQQQAQVWNYWLEANKERLAKYWSTLPESGLQDSSIWELPTQKEMLFARIKKGQKPATGYPMFINLHGGGTLPTATWKWGAAFNDSEWAAAKKLGAMYKDEPSLYFVPRMADDRRGRWYHRGEQTAFIRAWQLAVLAGDADPDRIHVVGISEGGYGSFRMGLFFADYFAGIGPMAGIAALSEAPIENIRNTAFYASVGEFDHAYGRSVGGQQWKLALDSAAKNNNGQFPHIVDIQKGRGHGIDYFKTTAWLRNFSRKPYPDTVSFQYYAVHDTVFNRVNDSSYTYRNSFAYCRLDGLQHTAVKQSDGLLETAVRDFYWEKSGNTYRIQSKNRVGEVQGDFTLYLSEIDFTKPVQVWYNGKVVYQQKVKLNVGTMLESMALFGDPKRIFAAKLTFKIT